MVWIRLNFGTQAEKCARFLGHVLSVEYGLEDRRGEAALDEAWRGKKEAYEAEIAAQKIKYGIE